MSADIEVEVTLQTNSSGFAEAKPNLPAQMGKLKTVHYFTRVTNATVRIEFVPDPANPPGFLSPFVENGQEIKVVNSTDPPFTLRNAGKFVCRCFLDVGAPTTFGWGPNTPGAGGNHVVN